MSENKSYIPNRLKNASKEHPYVAGAVDIIDDRLNQNQQDVNAGFESAIAGLNDQNYVTVEATDEDTSIESIMTRAGVTPQKDTVYRVGFWDGTQYDESKYSEYAWNDVAEEWKLLDVKEYTLATAEDFIEPDAEKRAKVVPVGAAADVYGAYEENPEFVDAKLDVGGRIMEAIKHDGTKVVFGDFEAKRNMKVLGDIYSQGGITSQKDITAKKDLKVLGNIEIGDIVFTVITNPEWVYAVIDAGNKLLFGVNFEGKFFADYGNINDYLPAESASQGNVINIATFNTGDFGGNGITPPSERGKMLYTECIAELNAGILATQEDVQMYGDIYDGSIHLGETREDPAVAIYGVYKNYYRMGKKTLNYKAFLSNGTFKNLEAVNYVSPAGHSYVFNHYYFLVGDTVVGKKPLKTVCVHLDWADIDRRREQIRQIIAYCDGLKYVAICGDFNHDVYVNGVKDPTLDIEEVRREELDMFTDAGYTLANGGAFGDFITYISGQQTGKLDNVIIKGGFITDVEVHRKDFMNDHFPLCATVIFNK